MVLWINHRGCAFDTWLHMTLAVGGTLNTNPTTISLSNKLDSDQAQHFVGPDLAGSKLFANASTFYH